MHTLRTALFVAIVGPVISIVQMARANSIAIDFVGGSTAGEGATFGGGPVTAMAASEVAGVVAQDNWNDAGISGQSSKYVNNTGVLSAGSVVDNQGNVLSNVTVTWNAYNTFSTDTPDVAGNDRMMKGYLDTSNADPYDSSDTLVTISNLPSKYTSSGYDLYVYYDGLLNVGSPYRVGQYEVFGGPTTSGPLINTIYGADTAAFDGTFIKASGTSVGNATSGNYIEFTGLTASTLTLQAFGEAGDVPRAPINGIQLVAVPEPSSLALLVLCGLSLGIVAASTRPRRF